MDWVLATEPGSIIVPVFIGLLVVHWIGWYLWGKEEMNPWWFWLALLTQGFCFISAPIFLVKILRGALEPAPERLTYQEALSDSEWYDRNATQDLADREEEIAIRSKWVEKSKQLLDAGLGNSPQAADLLSPTEMPPAFDPSNPLHREPIRRWIEARKAAGRPMNYDHIRIEELPHNVIPMESAQERPHVLRHPDEEDTAIKEQRSATPSQTCKECGFRSEASRHLRRCPRCGTDFL